jgi:putative FmdB family regulatory protein
MPIYEYRCTSCGHELEALQKLSDAPLTECPACKASALAKKVSAAGFQFKGSGCYVTDFRTSGAQSTAKGDKGAADAKPSADAKGETRSETTSTTTTESGGATETKSTTTVNSDKTGS